MGTGIACGVASNPDVPVWIIALGAMPCIPEVIIQAVVAGLEQGADISAPVWNKQHGHPVGFSARHAQAMLRLHDDAGARSIIQANRGLPELIETTEIGVIVDMDTQDSVQLAESDRCMTTSFAIHSKACFRLPVRLVEQRLVTTRRWWFG
jgi:molybdenum cofactor cytidylyltransferase